MNFSFRKAFAGSNERIFTIPNILSIVRILLVPVIIYLYCFKQDNLWSLIVVLLSTFTDIADGFIARKFNMITDFGKFIDPVADKATQLTIFACLITRFPVMIVPFLVLLVKELGSLALRGYVYKKTGLIRGAKWHGKASTGFVIIVIMSHLVWPNINSTLSLVMVCFITLFMLVSGTLYTLEAFEMMKDGKK